MSLFVVLTCRLAFGGDAGPVVFSADVGRDPSEATYLYEISCGNGE